jgi:molecular chaperone GrpE
MDDATEPLDGEPVSGPLADDPGVAEPAPAPAADELLNRLMRLQAEYENYRKRVTREQQEWTRRAVERLVLDLLPVLDSFDRALVSAEGSTDAGAVLEGMKLVMRQLAEALAQNGVKPIEARGEPFDPNHHEAFLSRPVAAGEQPGILVEEILKGYRMGDRTIRATRGIVTVPAERDPGPDPGSEDE